MKIAFKIAAKNGVLQKWLEDHNMNQAELARELNVSPSAVGDWLAMNSIPKNPELITKIEAYFSLPIEYIFPPELKQLKDVPKKGIVYKEMDALPWHQLKMLPTTTDYESFDFKEQINKVLATLKPREEKVLRMRLGFEGEPYTLEEIGNVLGIQRERVRQIEAKALRKLKHPKTRKDLEGFLEQNKGG